MEKSLSQQIKKSKIFLQLIGIVKLSAPFNSANQQKRWYSYSRRETGTQAWNLWIINWCLLIIFIY